MERFLIIFTMCLTASFLMSEVFYKLRYPRVVGQIVAGIILGSSIFAGFLFQYGTFFNALELNDPVAVMIHLLSSLGMIFLLLLVGLELNLKKLKEVSRDVMLIAFFASVIPFALGFILMKFLGYSDLIALIVGACLSITAEGTKAMVLIELDKLNTRVGEIMMAAGAMDDITGVLFLSTILVLVQEGRELSFLGSFLSVNISPFQEIHQSFGNLFHFIIFPMELFIFVVLAYITFKIFPRIITNIQMEKSENSEFMAIILVGLFIAMLSGILDLGTIIGAHIAGIIIQLSIKDKEEEQRMVNNLKMVSLGLIVPFFFIAIGMQFDISSLFNNPQLFILITGVAIIGKIGGCLIVEPFTKLTHKQLYLIGWGMNSRGVVELIIASIAYPIFVQENALEVFSVIVTMAILTTLIFPVILRYEIKKYPGIME